MLAIVQQIVVCTSVRWVPFEKLSIKAHIAHEGKSIPFHISNIFLPADTVKPISKRIYQQQFFAIPFFPTKQ